MVRHVDKVNGGFSFQIDAEKMNTHHSRPFARVDRRLRIYPAHSFSHDHDLANLLDLLEPDWVQGRDFVIMAPRVHDPLHVGGDNRELAHHFINLMSVSDLVWVMAGRYATESPWIGVENAYTAAIDKPVVAIARLAQERLSTVATAEGTRPVARWRKDSIISASLSALPTALRSEFLAAKKRRDQAPDILAGMGSTPLSSRSVSAFSYAMETVEQPGLIRWSRTSDPLDGLSLGPTGEILGVSALTGLRHTTDASALRQALRSMLAKD